MPAPLINLAKTWPKLVGTTTGASVFAKGFLFCPQVGLVMLKKMVLACVIGTMPLSAAALTARTVATDGGDWSMVNTAQTVALPNGANWTSAPLQMPPGSKGRGQPAEKRLPHCPEMSLVADKFVSIFDTVESTAS